MKRSIIALALTALVMTGCAPAVASYDPDETKGFGSVSDVPSDEGRVWVRVERNKGELPKVDVELPPEAAEPQEQVAGDDGGEAWEPEPCYGPAAIQGNPDGLNSFVGVVEYDGHVETAYSSNVLYHENTPEWTPDEQGFYKTDDGYYVVASSDYEQGTVIETSQGKAIVLDDGCSNGVVDFYTNW